MRDLEYECDARERHIRGRGGIDLAILGIGNNGHITLNERGTPSEVRAHHATLSFATRGALRRRFGNDVPREGLTVGIAAILEARAILLLASGRGKVRVPQRALRSVPTPALSTLALQRHPHVTLVADAGALTP